MSGKGKAFKFARRELTPPCTQDCQRRKPGCGAKCPEWLEYVEKRNQLYKARAEEAENNRLSPGRVAMMNGKAADRDRVARERRKK